MLNNLIDYLSPIVAGCWTLIVGFYVLHKKGRYSGPVSDPNAMRSRSLADDFLDRAGSLLTV